MVKKANKTTARKSAVDVASKAAPKAAAAANRGKQAALKSAVATKTPAVAVKEKKAKTVRDSFNMPDFDYALIGALKKRALAVSIEVKKSELLRAGIKSLAAMPEKEFVAALKSVHVVKTGRPGKKK
jgi:hypothetical protein